MDKQPVGQLPDLTQSNNDDEIMVITNSEHNQLKKEKISDFITDLTSTDENNAIVKGTDGKLFTKDFGNASNITEGTLPIEVLPSSGVTADTYAYPSSVTVNAQGMVTAIEEGTPSGSNADTDLSNITDAGKEVIRENSASIPIGTLYPSFAAAGYVPEFALPANGTEYSGTQFPALWSDYLTAQTPKLLTKNYTQYQADITAYGKCAAFGVEHTISATHTGTGITDVEVTAATWETKVSAVGSYVFSFDGTNWSLDSTAVELADYGIVLTGTPASGDTVTVGYAYGTTFKVPYLPDGTFVSQAMSDEELDRAYNAGLPNIEGSLTPYEVSGMVRPDGDISGAFKVGNTAYSASLQNVASTSYNLLFNASASNPIYGASDTVQPEAVSLRWFVVVANAVENEAAMDWAEWASALAGKANVDLSNCTKPYVTETYWNDQTGYRQTGYRVWSNGFCEQWMYILGTAVNYALTVELLKPYKNKGSWSIQITTDNSAKPANYFCNVVHVSKTASTFEVTTTVTNVGISFFVYTAGYIE